MADFCELTIGGRIVKRPDIKDSGTPAYISFSVASNNVPVFDKETKAITEYKPTYLDVVFYDSQAERLAKENLDKGMGIVIIGDLQMRTYEDDEGPGRSRYILRGRKWFLPSSSASGEGVSVIDGDEII